jgi:hypothetical protein
VACDKQKTALVCFFEWKYHTSGFLGLRNHLCDISTKKTLVWFSYYAEKSIGSSALEFCALMLHSGIQKVGMEFMAFLR